MTDYSFITDPDRWTTSRCEGTRLVNRGPRVGEVIGYRYSAWRVTDVREVPTVDLDAGQSARISAGGRRPYDLELTHLTGPMIDGVERLIVQGDGVLWMWLGERYRACSCHGHPFPCQEYDRDVLVATLNRDARRKLASAAPGVCAYCRTPITGRQPLVVFPEPSLIVPGAPGPRFHARRQDCWWAAHQYETKQRLVVYPEADRVASCPGVGFVHTADLRFECTAGPFCTDLHGPWRRDQGNCATRVYRAENMAAGYQRPISDCGYRGRGDYNCLGAETGPCRPSLFPLPIRAGSLGGPHDDEPC